MSGEEAIAYFERFVALHAEHWRPQGKSGHFGDWPRSEAFNRELVARMAANGRARFYEIAAGGRPIAIAARGTRRQSVPCTKSHSTSPLERFVSRSSRTTE